MIRPRAPVPPPIRLAVLAAAISVCACSSGGSGASTPPRSLDASGTIPGYVALLPSTLVIQEGRAGTVSVRAFDESGAPVAAPPLAVEPAAVATVSGTTVSALSTGGATIYALDARGKRSVGTIRAVSSGISIPPDATQLAAVPAHVVVSVGETRAIEAGAFGLDGHPVAQVLDYVSLNTTVATVTADGVVHGHAVGTTEIAISSANAVAPVSVGVTVAPLSSSSGSPLGTTSLVGVKPAIGYAYLVLWARGAATTVPMVLTYWDPRHGVYVKTTTTEGEWKSVAPIDPEAPWWGAATASVDAAGTITPHRCGSAEILFDPKDPSGLTASFYVEVTPDWTGTWTCKNDADWTCKDRFVASMHPILSAPIVYPLGMTYEPLMFSSSLPALVGDLFQVDAVAYRDFSAPPIGADFSCSNLAACDRTNVGTLPTGVYDCDGTTIWISKPMDVQGAPYWYVCNKGSQDLCGP
jgi:hypothetical protein